MMFRQHLDTAPIWEAYRTDCECPLCLLKARCEADYVGNFLGGSVMEPDVRIEVNEKGFCRRHLGLLYDANNRLGLALMADTHMKEIIGKLKKRSGTAVRGGRLHLGRKAGAAEKMSESCILCDRLENTMDRYEETVLYMWQKEEAFRETFSSGKGPCLMHYERLYTLAEKEMSGKDRQAFLQALNEVMLRNFERVEQELNWFTLKFDYRNQDKPWGNSRDAVERAVIKLRGGLTAEQEAALRVEKQIVHNK